MLLTNQPISQRMPTPIRARRAPPWPARGLGCNAGAALPEAACGARACRRDAAASIRSLYCAAIQASAGLGRMLCRRVSQRRPLVASGGGKPRAAMAVAGGLRRRLLSAAAGARQPVPGKPWFEDGLRFSCTECGKCCTGEPGVVWFEPHEAGGLAAELGISTADFYKDHARLVKGRFSLKELERPDDSFLPAGHDCEFLVREPGQRRARCRVHKARPQQCKTWPFWPRVLASKEAWEAEAPDCPGILNGIRGDGTLYSAGEIAEQARLDALAMAQTAPR